ncbi:hypothetical protein V9L05_15190 [Bernardetia sp. Wsw4-3y2]|uniref:hypothetical protein n=1 Tax=Bernardetia sp. Wsw4-3y2 TaxID=3127471 RepID=UPI0030D11850
MKYMKKWIQETVIPVPEKVFVSIKADFEERGVNIEKTQDKVLIMHKKKEFELRYDIEKYQFWILWKGEFIHYSQDIDDIIDCILI